MLHARLWIFCYERDKITMICGCCLDWRLEYENGVPVDKLCLKVIAKSKWRTCSLRPLHENRWLLYYGNKPQEALDEGLSRRLRVCTVQHSHAPRGFSALRILYRGPRLNVIAVPVQCTWYARIPTNGGGWGRTASQQCSPFIHTHSTGSMSDLSA